MRISCIIGPYLPIPTLLGGAVEKIFLALCEEFAARGHEVTMISRRFRDLAHDERVNGVRHIRVPSRDMPAGKIAYRVHDILYALRASKALPKSDVTITNSVSLPLLLPRGKAGRIYVDVARYPKGQMGMYRRVDRLQACSTHIANAIIEQSPSVAHLVKAVPNAITSVFAARAAEPLEIGRQAKEIVFVGRVAREKGIDLLVKGFALVGAKYPDWKLVVVGPHLASQGGDGEDFLAELQALAAQSGAAVEFTGPIFDEVALADRYARSAIFVYPSVAEKGEAFPLAPLEAMACGCAPVLSDLRCFDDAFRPEQNGIRFDHRDPAGKPLAEALERLMASEELRVRIATAAKKTGRDYTPPRVAALFLQDFAGLTGLPVEPKGTSATSR